MKQLIRNWRFTVWMIITLMISFPSCKAKNNDSDIQTAFNTKSLTDSNLASVSAIVIDGTVTLTGSCIDEACRIRAEKIVQEIRGVRKIINNIQVTNVVVPEDGLLRTSTVKVASRYEGVQAGVDNGVITITGTIDDQEKLQQLIQELQALHPKNVRNQLIIKNN